LRRPREGWAECAWTAASRSFTRTTTARSSAPPPVSVIRRRARRRTARVAAACVAAAAVLAGGGILTARSIGDPRWCRPLPWSGGRLRRTPAPGRRRTTSLSARTAAARASGMPRPGRNSQRLPRRLSRPAMAAVPPRSSAVSPPLATTGRSCLARSRRPIARRPCRSGCSSCAWGRAGLRARCGRCPSLAGAGRGRPLVPEHFVQDA